MTGKSSPSKNHAFCPARYETRDNGCLNIVMLPGDVVEFRFNVST